MKYTVMGTGTLAQAISLAAAAVENMGMERTDERHAELAIVCGSAQEVETLGLHALNQGMHAAVPGWMAGDGERLERLHQLFKQGERKLLLLFPERYAPNVQDVQRVLHTGRLGRIGMLDYVCQWPREESALLPLAEAVDTVLSWMGKIQTLRGFRTGAENVNCATLSACFANGALLNLAAVCSPQETWRTVYEWSGSEGNMAYDSQEACSVRIRNEEEVKQRFPLLGTQVCPLKAMLQDVPRLMEEHGFGASEADLKLAALICEAFEKEDAAHA